MIRPFTDVAGRKADAWAYTVWGALIWVLGLAPAVRQLPDLHTFASTYQEAAINPSANQGGVAWLVGLAFVVLPLGLGGMGILLGFALRGAWLPKAGLGLWLGAMAWVLGLLISSRFGLHPFFSLGLLGIPTVFTAAYFLPPVSLSWVVRQVKRLLPLYAYGSLLAALIIPQRIVEYPYTAGLIPGFEIRLHGLASHANNLALLFLTYLILSWFSPSRTRWDWLHWVVVLLALILTQSKTVWILLVLAYLIRLAYAAWSLPGLQRYTALAFLGSLYSGGIFLYLVPAQAWVNDSVGSIFSDPTVTTLTGRSFIWRITISIWEQNFWFGYGPGLWDQQMSLDYAPLIGFFAVNAHNEALQTLGMSGTVGGIGLVLYVIALAAYSLRYGRATNGVALALVSVMLLRGATEAVFAWAPGNENFYVHFLTFAFLMLVSRQKSALDEEFKGTHGEWPLTPRPSQR